MQSDSSTPLSERSEDDLVKLAQSGETGAFDVLFGRYYQRIYEHCYRLLSKQEDAEEAAQDTFVKAARYLGNFRGDSSFKTWIWRIAINACHDLRQKRKRHQGAEVDMELMEGKPDPDWITSQAILEAIECLPEKQRVALVLTEMEEHSHEEAAQMLGVSINTVSWRVYAAKGKLKKLLKKRGFE